MAAFFHLRNHAGVTLDNMTLDYDVNAGDKVIFRSKSEYFLP
jgi:hypothetical protein